MTDDLYERYKEALRIGHVAVLRGSLEEALGAYRAAAEIAPSRALPHTSLGGALLRLGRLEEALVEFAAAIARAPHDEGALLGQAEALTAAGQRAEAARVLDHVSEIEEAAGRLPEAADTLRRALELEESPERARRQRGLRRETRLSAGDQAAEQLLARALRLRDEPAPRSIEPAHSGAPAPLAGQTGHSAAIGQAAAYRPAAAVGDGHVRASASHQLPEAPPAAPDTAAAAVSGGETEPGPRAAEFVRYSSGRSAAGPEVGTGSATTAGEVKAPQTEAAAAVAAQGTSAAGAAPFESADVSPQTEMAPVAAPPDNQAAATVAESPGLAPEERESVAVLALPSGLIAVATEPDIAAVGVMEGAVDTVALPGMVGESDHQPTGDELLIAAEAADAAGDLKALRLLLVWTARAYAREGRFDAGLDATHRLLQRSPGDVDAHLVLVELYVARHWNALAAEKLALLGRLADLDDDAETRARVCAVASRAFPNDQRLESLCSS